MLDHDDGSSHRSVLHGGRSRRTKEANSAEHNQCRQGQQRQALQETAYSAKTTNRTGNRAQKLASLSQKNTLRSRRLSHRRCLSRNGGGRSSRGRNSGSVGGLSDLRRTGCMSRTRRANRLRRRRHTRTPLHGAGGHGAGGRCAGGVKYHQTCRKVCRSAVRSNRCCSSHCGSFLSARPGVAPRV